MITLKAFVGRYPEAALQGSHHWPRDLKGKGSIAQDACTALCVTSMQSHVNVQNMNDLRVDAAAPRREPTVLLSVGLMDSMWLPGWKLQCFDMWCAPCDTSCAVTEEQYKDNKPPSQQEHFTTPQHCPYHKTPSFTLVTAYILLNKKKEAHRRSVGVLGPAAVLDSASIINWPEWWGHAKQYDRHYPCQ